MVNLFSLQKIIYYGCSKCGKIDAVKSFSTNKKGVSKTYRHTTDTFIERSKQIHNNKYNYSKVNYIGNGIEVIIICSKHGEFTQTPNAHLQGSGCKKCGRQSCSSKATKKLSQFIEDAKKVHNNKYDYSLVNYVNNVTKIIIICPDHGKFEQTPYRHLIGHKCKECSKYGKNEFIEKANKIHNNKYKYDKVEYIGSDISVTITCTKHGDFIQKPRNHIKGSGCQICSNSGYSQKAIKWLNYISHTKNINIQHMENGGEFKIPGTTFKTDGYCKETNTIYEFNGCQFHACCLCTNHNEINPFKKVLNKQIFEETIKREIMIRLLGYNLVVIWEHEWDKFNK